jgi:hypothetical protein
MPCSDKHFIPILDELRQREEQTLSENPCRSVVKKGRGGPRPNSGPPRGNLNALKHGRYSAQFAALGTLIALNPRLRETILALAQRHNLKAKKAEAATVELFGHIMRHAAEVAAGRTDKPFLPNDLKRLMKELDL